MYKWIGLSVGLLLALILLAGLSFRWLSTGPPEPIGELVDVGGFSLHIQSSGERNKKPTIVIEGGAGTSSEYYHWLSEGLKDSVRVVRYDRAGLGYSDTGNTPRNAETIARELHELLEKAGESAPYILVGHSIGGTFIRVFAAKYPDELVAMVFLDPTHPEYMEPLHATQESFFEYKSMIWTLQISALAGDIGLLGLSNWITGRTVISENGLPDDINNRMQHFLEDGKHLRGLVQEVKNYHTNLKQASEANDLRSIPIRIFTATEIDQKVFRQKGRDPHKVLSERIQALQEFAEQSPDGEQILIDANHTTLCTKKEHADIICSEIYDLLVTLDY